MALRINWDQVNSKFVVRVKNFASSQAHNIIVCQNSFTLRFPIRHYEDYKYHTGFP